MAVLTFPTPDEQRRHFDAYCLALGKVAHAWNYLFEKLGRLFVVVAGGDKHVANAIWYAPDSDRTKVGMLRAAIDASVNAEWPRQFPTAKADMIWLLQRVDSLTDTRNNVIHAPCVLRTDGTGTAMAASFNGHQRAKKLWGKEILVEFEWCECWTESLSRFSQEIERALTDPEPSWPARPSKPARSSEKDLLLRLLPE